MSTWDQLGVGTHRVVLRVTDSGGLSAFGSFEVIVVNSDVRTFGLELANCGNIALQVGSSTADNQIARCY